MGQQERSRAPSGKMNQPWSLQTVRDRWRGGAARRGITTDRPVEGEFTGEVSSKSIIVVSSLAIVGTIVQ